MLACCALVIGPLGLAAVVFSHWWRWRALWRRWEAAGRAATARRAELQKTRN